MQLRHTLASAIAVIALATSAGCAVTRGQESVGAYVDDATITSSVKARFVHPDFRRRIEIDDLLAALRRASEGR